MPKSPDEFEYPQEPPESGETKPQREIFKEIAKTQLDCLHYSYLVKQLTDFFKGQGAIADLAKTVPHIFGNNNKSIDKFIETMERIPNSEETRRLMATAIFGEPTQRNADGTVTVTSFNLAEPSTTKVQTKFTMLRDNEDNPRYVANKKGTDGLVRKLISATGFLEEAKIAEIIFQLKKGKKISLPHPQNKSLTMDIESPIDSGDGKSSTAYSYHIQTILKGRHLS